MIGKRLYAGIALLVCSCGDYTPPGAVIQSADPDRSTTYSLNVVPTQVTDGTIHFKVVAAPLSSSPVVGVKVDLSGTSPTAGDPNSGFVAGGVILNPSDPNHIEATTDTSGVVAVLYRFTVPKCNITDDLLVSATISASIGTSSAAWTDSITVKTDPSC